MRTLFKGSMKIDMPQNTFALHEFIKGDVILRLRKPIQARGLSICLEGKEMVFTDGTLDEDHGREWQIFCEQKVPLGGEQLYYSGKYAFKIEVPMEASRGLGKGRGAAGKVLKTVGGFVGTLGTIEWHLLARLDVPMGIDLTDKKPIYFRMTGDVRKKSASEELREAKLYSARFAGRKQLVIKQQEAPTEEVYGDAVALCPQCDSPYLLKKKPKQCDVCGEFLPQDEGDI